MSWGLALAFYLLTYVLMRRCGASSGVAATAVVLFMTNPNAMWMENAVYYGLPLALLLLVATLAFANALRGSSAWLACASVAVVLMPLTRAFFTIIWCALLLTLMSYGAMRAGIERKRVAAAVLLPFTLVIAFQVKQSIVFGQVLGSSWFGCNLAAMTGGMRAEKAADLAAGKVSPLVNVYRNDPPETYMPFFRTTKTGIPVLDETRKSTGEPNFNHSIYIPVGRQYLSDTLYLIVHHPHKYLGNVANSIYILSGFQIGVYFDHPSRFFARWRWIDIAAPFIGFPLIILAIASGIRRLRLASDDSTRMLTLMMLFNTVYVLGVSAFLEKSEGAVYRHQIDAFLWTFLATRVTEFLPAAAVVRDEVVKPDTLSDVRN
jgi:hypothetical protein